jgi:L-asparaginase II
VAEVRVEVVRGEIVESVHVGHVAMADAHGRLLKAGGEPETVTFYRSVAKPFQTMALILSGAVDAFGFGPEEIAIVTSSHNGERVHTEAVTRILDRIGLDASALMCGAHAPWDRETAEALTGPPSPLHSNCSGKHAGMLAEARHLGLDLSYLDLEHPVQQRVLDVLTVMTGRRREEIGVAVDGCGVPSFAVPVASMAASYARLAAPAALPGTYQDAAQRVVAAVTQHPYLVAGRGRFDTDLMQATGGRILSKSGAEGVAAVAVPSLGIGIAFKVADGQSRALPPIMTAVLRQEGLIDADEAARLEPYAHPAVPNVAGRVVGEIRARVTLGGPGR